MWRSWAVGYVPRQALRDDEVVPRHGDTDLANCFGLLLIPSGLFGYRQEGPLDPRAASSTPPRSREAFERHLSTTSDMPAADNLEINASPCEGRTSEEGASRRRRKKIRKHGEEKGTSRRHGGHCNGHGGRGKQLRWLAALHQPVGAGNKTIDVMSQMHGTLVVLSCVAKGRLCASQPVVTFSSLDS